MKKINSIDGSCEVEIFKNGTDGSWIATAVLNDGMSYGGDSYWFNIGHYKSEESAIKFSIKKMSKMNRILDLDNIVYKDW